MAVKVESAAAGQVGEEPASRGWMGVGVARMVVVGVVWGAGRVVWGEGGSGGS